MDSATKLKLTHAGDEVFAWFQADTGEFKSKMYKLNRRQFEGLYNAVIELRRLLNYGLS